jgi:arabinogalactan endo-1,4-beta-galactosidase
MRFDEVTAAIEDATRTVNQADRIVKDLAHLCAGRLRKANVSSWVLQDLKRELANYNIHTSSWKD